MNIETTVLGLVFHAITVVGIMEWLKRITDTKKRMRWHIIAMPLIAFGVAFASNWEVVTTALRVLSWSQLAYPLLVKLPERLIKGKVE